MIKNRKKKRLVVIESPYGEDVTTHKGYLQECILDCLERGEAPFASHQMYTDALDDDNSHERKLGIDSGFAWMKVAEAVIFYIDFGWSKGMLAALQKCSEIRIDVEIRKISRFSNNENQELKAAILGQK